MTGLKRSLLIAFALMASFAPSASASVTVGTVKNLGVVSLAGISCSTPTFCAAVAPGAVLAAQNGVSDIGSGVAFQSSPLSTPSSIGCSPGTTGCEVVGYDGSKAAAVRIVDNTAGDQFTYPDAASALRGAACYAGGCVGVGSITVQAPPYPTHGLVVPFVGGVAGAGQYTPEDVGMNAVACPGSNCVAVGADGVVVPLTTSGNPGHAAYASGPETLAQLTAVACADSLHCLAVGTGGIVVPIVGGVPGAKHAIAGINRFDGVACSNSTTCVAVGTAPSGGVVVPMTPAGIAGSPIPVAIGLNGISCSGVSCIAIGTDGSRAKLLPVSTGTATSTTVASSANPSKPAQSVTLTAHVNHAGGGSPTGTVTFKDGAATLGSAPLAAGSATFTTSALSVGTHSITATYGGDADFGGSASAVLSQTVSTPPDRTPPQTRITKRPARTIRTTKSRVRVGFRFSSSEPHSRFRCKLDHARYGACRAPKSYVVKPGSHKFYVVAIDAAGNADPSPASASFKVVKVRHRH